MAVAVETLTVSAPSPPVPQVSRQVAGRGTGIERDHPLADRPHGPQQFVGRLALLVQSGQERPGLGLRRLIVQDRGDRLLALCRRQRFPGRQLLDGQDEGIRTHQGTRIV